MSGCNSCCKCYRQADGTIVKRHEENGVFLYQPQGSGISETAPANFISTDRVGCEEFDLANKPPVPAQVLEVVDADGNQVDDQLVRLIDYPDGSTKWKDLKTGTEYDTEAAYLTAIGHAGGTTHTSEDTDYNERTVVLCDEGVDVISTIIFRDGDITDIISTTVTKLDGSTHTLSGNERAGACAALVKTDQENACFLEVDANGVPVPDKPKLTGYIQYTTDAAVVPAVTTSAYYDSADAALVKHVAGTAGFIKVDCC